MQGATMESVYLFHEVWKNVINLYMKWRQILRTKNHSKIINAINYTCPMSHRATQSMQLCIQICWVTLTYSEKEYCDRDISIQDLTDAIQSMQLNKSPWSDCLTSELLTA